MSEEFDAYHKWLGIRPEDQPPNHYQLLGVALFESDPAVIGNAADRRMAYLRSQSAGPNAKLSQVVLNEISAAKLCLLNPSDKAAYDATLSSAPPVTVVATALPPAAFAQQVPAPPPVAEAAAAVTPAVTANPVPQIRTTRLHARRRTRRSQSGFWLFALTLVLLLGSVVGYAAWQSRGRDAGEDFGSESTGDADVSGSEDGETEPPASAPSDKVGTAEERDAAGNKSGSKPAPPLVRPQDHATRRELSPRQLQSTPEVETQLEVADGWYALADDSSILLPALGAHQQKSLRLHAQRLYENLLPWAEGRAKEHAEARLSEIRAALR